MQSPIRINGEAAESFDEDAEILETEPGVYSILSGGASFEARVTGNEITINGRRFAFEIEDARRWKPSGRASGRAGSDSITASMPGKVVRVLVAVGDQVTVGQGIVVVEAMKMQSELKSPRDGRVTSIEVAENESVNAGALLAKIE